MDAVGGWCWLHRQAGGGPWVRLRKEDERNLNEAIAQPTFSWTRPSTVAVFGGRWDAVLATDGCILRPRYEDMVPMSLMRSRWCFKFWPNGPWTPFSLEDDQALEQTWQTMVGEGGISSNVAAPSTPLPPALLEQLAEQETGTQAALSPSSTNSAAASATPALHDAAVAHSAQPAMPPLVSASSSPGPVAEELPSLSSELDAPLGVPGLTPTSQAPNSTAAADAANASQPTGIELCGLITADGKHSVTFRRKEDGQISITMRPASGKWSAVSWYSHRGWAGEGLTELSPEELAYETAQPAALVLVVHGIGERLWTQRDNLIGLTPLRESVIRMRQAAAKAAALGGVQRVEFLPVEWHSTLQEDIVTATRLAQVTPPSVPLLRQIANEVICDVLYYEQATHRRRIQRAVVSRANEIVRAWLTHHESFAEDGGVVILMAHSLGSVICFDLLSSKAAPVASEALPPQTSAGTPVSETAMPLVSEATSCEPTGLQTAPSAFKSEDEGIASGQAVVFDFPVAACVALGSPVACFCALRGLQLGYGFRLPSCPRYFNLYHRNDPVAYRLEPLLIDPDDGSASTEAALKPPEYVPFAGDKDGQRLHVKLRKKVREVQRSVSAVQRWFGSTVAAAAAAVDEGSLDPLRAASKLHASEDAENDSGDERLLFALNAGERVDWRLQLLLGQYGSPGLWQAEKRRRVHLENLESELEVANEYLSALQAHTMYYESQDVLSFVLRYVLPASTPQRPQCEVKAASSANKDDA